jgi:hypothetical protein
VHLFAVYYDVRRSSDAEADLVTAEADHCDDDIAADAQGFIGAAAEDEHVFSLLELRQIRNVPFIRQGAWRDSGL